MLIMWALMLLVFAASTSNEDKENICYILASRSPSQRTAEIEEYLSQNKLVSQPALKPKLLEDSFYLCIDNITEEDIEFFRREKLTSFAKLTHLTHVPLNRYKNLQDVKISHEFIDKKKDITMRMPWFQRDL